ncbi:hypothetical protein KA017_03865 [Candidatus Woesebacteria bacterium]|nr:hypothetical protein [Candidatus Woesebacteria bacterium]
MRNFNNSNNTGGNRGSFSNSDRGGNRGGRDSRGSSSSNRPRFGSQNSGGFNQMHDATCADCGGDCKVPFLPTSGKPVYCSDCFEKRGNGNGDSRRSSFNDRPNFSEKRNFSDKKSFTPRNDRNQDSYNKPTENFSKQFETLNAKLDAVLALLAEKEIAPAVTPEAKTETAPKEPKVKKVAKTKKVKAVETEPEVA